MRKQVKNGDRIKFVLFLITLLSTNIKKTENRGKKKDKSKNCGDSNFHWWKLLSLHEESNSFKLQIISVFQNPVIKDFLNCTQMCKAKHISILLFKTSRNSKSSFFFSVKRNSKSSWTLLLVDKYHNESMIRFRVHKK